jgi:predicted Zn-dependent protease with MMP-like domain
LSDVPGNVAAESPKSSGLPIKMLHDRILVFRGPTQRMCADRAELVREVSITVVHEIAHHFGIDDDRLHELGWA